jgi:hypothetical protein
MKLFWTIPCSVCGTTNGKKEGHHRIRSQKGGPDNLSNVLPLCMDCHELVHGTNKSQFMREVSNRTKLCNLDLYDYLNGNDDYILSHWEEYKSQMQGYIFDYLSEHYDDKTVREMML